MNNNIDNNKTPGISTTLFPQILDLLQNRKCKKIDKRIDKEKVIKILVLLLAYYLLLLQKQ